MVGTRGLCPFRYGIRFTYSHAHTQTQTQPYPTHAPHDRTHRRVSNQWPMPPVRRLWRNSPTKVLSHLLGHEGPGSLFATLQDRGLATSVSAGMRVGHDDFSLFQVRGSMNKYASTCTRFFSIFFLSSNDRRGIVSSWLLGVSKRRVCAPRRPPLGEIAHKHICGRGATVGHTAGANPCEGGDKRRSIPGLSAEPCNQPPTPIVGSLLFFAHRQ